MCLNFSCYRVRLHRRPHKNLCRDLCGTEMEVPWWAVQEATIVMNWACLLASHMTHSMHYCNYWHQFNCKIISAALFYNNWQFPPRVRAMVTGICIRVPHDNDDGHTPSGLFPLTDGRGVLSVPNIFCHVLFGLNAYWCSPLLNGSPPSG